MHPRRLIVLLLTLLLLTCGSVDLASLPVYQAHAELLTYGPVVGGVTPTSATIFVRTSSPKDGSLWLTPQSGPTVITAFTTTTSSDLTAIVPVSNLSPSTRYVVTLPDSARQTVFTTGPPATSTDPLTLLYLTDFQGPNNHPKEPTGLFALATAENPDIVLIGGDFDHSNPGAFPKGTNPATVIASYRTMWKNLYDPLKLPSFVPTVLNLFSIAHMRDDHDYGNNNEDKDFRWRTQSTQVFKEYMPTYPVAAPVDSYGVWQRFSYAYVDVFLVDTRSQRTRHGAPDDSQKSMLDGNFLGTSGQLHWLLDGLRTSTAIWKVILMPTPFNPTVIKSNNAPLTSQDSWTGYQYERALILNYFVANQIKNVIMLSGDLHAGALDNGMFSGVVEMVTPSANFTSQSPEKCLSADFIGNWSHGTYVKTNPRVCNGYGVVRITPTQMILQVKDEFGTIVLALTVQVR